MCLPKRGAPEPLAKRALRSVREFWHLLRRADLSLSRGIRHRLMSILSLNTHFYTKVNVAWMDGWHLTHGFHARMPVSAVSDNRW